MPRQAHRDADVLRPRADTLGDELDVHRIIVVKSLDGIGHTVLHGEGMITVGAGPPAEFISPLRTDHTAFARLCRHRSPGIPAARVFVFESGFITYG